MKHVCDSYSRTGMLAMAACACWRISTDSRRQGQSWERGNDHRRRCSGGYRDRMLTGISLNLNK